MRRTLAWRSTTSPQIVRARVGDGLVGLLDEGFQALPAERALDGRNLVFSLFLGREHGFRHAEQRPRRSIERLGALNDILLVLVIGAAEHGAEHLAEHGERGVGEDRLHLAREHDQRRQAARRVETRDMRGTEDGDFSGDRCVARAVNALLAIRADAEFTHGLQPFDNAGEIFLRGASGHSRSHASGVRPCSSLTASKASSPAIVSGDRPSTRFL